MFILPSIIVIILYSEAADEGEDEEGRRPASSPLDEGLRGAEAADWHLEARPRRLDAAVVARVARQKPLCPTSDAATRRIRSMY